MNTRRSVFIATSLDGYIARGDGSIDWLERANTAVPKGEDCGYAEFFSTVDALVMGRNTFEQALVIPDWPYGTKPVIVLSRTMRKAPRQAPASVRLAHESPAALVRSLAEQGLHHLYVDGGQTIQSFLSSGLIDEMTITVVPVLLGEGKPLFGQQKKDISLQLLASRAFPFGFVQSRYRVLP